MELVASGLLVFGTGRFLLELCDVLVVADYGVVDGSEKEVVAQLFILREQRLGVDRSQFRHRGIEFLNETVSLVDMLQNIFPEGCCIFKQRIQTNQILF